ncbi:MAG: hypothetical protein ACLQPD_23175, partial [Desulfomonilaceae bacterium]
HRAQCGHFLGIPTGLYRKNKCLADAIEFMFRRKASVTLGPDLSLRGRKAVAIPEALGDCFAPLAMTFFGCR